MGAHPVLCEHRSTREGEVFRDVMEGHLARPTQVPWIERFRAALSGAGFARDDEGSVLTGTAAGLAGGLGVDPAVTRVAFTVLALAGGAGVFLYGIAWLLLPPPGSVVTPRPRQHDLRRIAGVSCVTVGVLILLREAGWWFGDIVVWPAALAGLGAVMVWGRAGVLPTRMLAGFLLVVAGMFAFLAGNIDLAVARASALPVLVTVGGIVLILGPWLTRLGAQAAQERAERIRSEERAEVAAHLHDSVLQTLALIQRTDSTRRTSTLARLQERDLRAWLYGRSGRGEVRTLDAAVDQIASRVEVMFAIEALLGAAGEAMTNAARHSGAPKVSVYVEAEPDAVTGYVRDQGIGFDPDTVPEGCRGISESIYRRMQRHRGTATIHSAPGQGTEVQLRMERQ
jgi:phage shock protein PspC (stress-responsive transcriptional regulator)/energy-converting hydrogenase Eha subunit C